MPKDLHILFLLRRSYIFHHKVGREEQSRTALKHLKHGDLSQQPLSSTSSTRGQHFAVHHQHYGHQHHPYPLSHRFDSSRAEDVP
ncbi:hypothetical protein AOLI_G00303480 [Acnodon oligacanthus]